jgi:hypothetical protein
MKKRALFFLLIVGAGSTVFSLDEDWFSFGANFGNYFDNATDLGDFYIGSPGINLISGYKFLNQKMPVYSIILGLHTL